MLFTRRLISIECCVLFGRTILTCSQNNMKKLKRDMSLSNKLVTVLTPPEKSASDKKTYKVIRLPNNLTALLVSDGPDLYNVEDLNDISDSHSESSSASSGSEEEEGDDDYEAAYESCTNAQESVKNDKLAACALSVNVGSFCDPKEIPGLAHFLEHMLFMGSNKYPKENQFEDFVEKHGGSTNASTSAECTTFYFDCDVRYLFKALDIFSHFFISPLLKKECMVREREAVDSEFNAATSSDSARIEQLISSFACDQNPASKFMWGNLITLKDEISEDSLYTSLRDFYDKYYSANLMTLAILAKLPVDTLEDCAVEYFAGVPNRHAPKPEFSIAKPLFTDIKFHSIHYVSSVNDVTKVSLMWQLPPVQPLYRSKPDELIGWLLAHEGKGSLLSFLKSKLWALALWGGITNDSIYSNSLYSLFSLEISLSKDGFKHIKDVLTAAFSFMKLARSSLPNQRLFDEIKILSDIDFRFQEEESTSDFVEGVVEDMHLYPPQHYLSGPELYFDCDPAEVTKLLSHMTPDRVNIIVQAKEFDSITLDQTERWFQTKYTSRRIEDSWLQDWQSTESPYKEFDLPPPNSFISSDFSILQCSVKTKYPVRVKLTDTIEIWHKLDSIFQLPIASINLHFLSALGRSSCKSSVMIDLFINMLNYQLMEETYPATLAQLNFHLQQSSRGGVLVTLKGFNHKLPVLLDTIINGIKNFAGAFNSNMFNTLKTELRRAYRNGLLNRSTLAKELRFTITEQPYFNMSQKHGAVAAITEEDFLQFIKSFFGVVYVQCLVQGNMTQEQAVNVCSKSVEIFNTKPAPKEQLPCPRFRQIPKGLRCVLMKSFNSELENNSVTVNYYQWGPATMEQSVRLEMLMKLMDEKIFDVLRTKEQLGYTVYNMFTHSFGIIGFIVTVHSSSTKFDTAFVEERISSFMQSFTQLLSEYKSEEFLNEREALIKSKSIVDDNLKQEVEYNLSEIITEQYVFDRRAKEIECLQKVTLKEIQSMWTSIVSEDSDHNRRLSIQVVGNQKEQQQTEVERPLAEDESMLIKLLEGTKKEPNYYITDMEEFQNDLYLYPVSKILPTAEPDEAKSIRPPGQLKRNKLHGVNYDGSKKSTAEEK